MNMDSQKHKKIKNTHMNKQEIRKKTIKMKTKPASFSTEHLDPRIDIGFGNFRNGEVITLSLVYWRDFSVPRDSGGAMSARGSCGGRQGPGNKSER